MSTMIAPPSRRADDPRNPGDSSVELPVVVRPERLRLVDIEGRILRDPQLAADLRKRPQFCGVLARSLFTRDHQARMRFPDAASLAQHLTNLIGG